MGRGNSQAAGTSDACQRDAGLTPPHGSKEAPLWTVGRWVAVGQAIVVLYLLRTGLMNCTYPLEESLLMDYVPKETRGFCKIMNCRACLYY